MPSVVMRSAFDRIFRTLVISIGIGALVFTLLGLPGIFEQYPHINPGYTFTVIAVFSGVPTVMALIAFRTRVAILRALAAAHCVAALVFLALWLPNMTTGALPDDSIPWLINMITIGTCTAALALPFIGAWVYVFGIATLAGIVRFEAYGGGDTTVAFQDAVMVVLFSGFMMALLQLTMRAGREQDAAALAARDAAIANAAAENLERQRTRYHAFTHDDVLATLLAASQDGAEPSEITRRAAQRTLEKMNQFRDDEGLHMVMPLADFDAHVRHSASVLGVPLRSTLIMGDHNDLSIPTDIADALAEAFTEAMRNSVRHSDWPDGREVNREATATRTENGIELVVTDDGKGFNPRRISVDRLGVRLSIVQRVDSQPGGRAIITSARGEGTTVRLQWTAPVSE